MAQDTNFSAGPQYLVPSGNAMFLRSIATPSLDLSTATLAGTTDVPSIVELPALASGENTVYLHDVYWGEHSPDASFVPLLQTPSMTPDQTAGYMNYVAGQGALALPGSYSETSESAVSPALPPSQLTAGGDVIELTGGPMPANLPTSIFDPGVTGIFNPESMQHGYGLSLGEVAAYWKAHKRQAPRIFTDQDLRRK
jgi:hypothetical protein